MTFRAAATTTVLAVLLSMRGGAAAFSMRNNRDIAAGVCFNRRTCLQTITATAFTTAVPLVASAAAAGTKSVVIPGGKLRYGEESLMSPKAHGTSMFAVQEQLRYGVSHKLADKICNFNRHFAETAGYFTGTDLEEAILSSQGPLTFYDSVTGKPLFVAPINRTPQQFIAESQSHGWPSFRDDEVVWDNVRVLKNSGETVSIDGTHLGHNLPDRKGNRYCVNLTSVAGNPASS